MVMQRCLLVFDMDLLGLGEELDLGPINYLAGRPEQELLLGAATAHGQSAPAKYPTGPQPGHGVNADAEHRMNLAVRRLKAIGYLASGLTSDEELVKAMRVETRRHDYDEVILATCRQGGSWLARGLHRDPVHQLRRRWAQRLVIFSPGPGTTPSQ
jgi:hypothetical protein